MQIICKMQERLYESMMFCTFYSPACIMAMSATFLWQHESTGPVISSETLRPKMSPFRQLYIMARALAIFMVRSACCLGKLMKSGNDVWQKDVKTVQIGTKSSRTSDCLLISYCWFFRVEGHNLSWRLIFVFGWFVGQSDCDQVVNSLSSLADTARVQ